MKKIISIVLSILLICTMFASCSKPSQTEETESQTNSVSNKSESESESKYESYNKELIYETKISYEQAYKAAEAAMKKDTCDGKKENEDYRIWLTRKDYIGHYVSDAFINSNDDIQSSWVYFFDFSKANDPAQEIKILVDSITGKVVYHEHWRTEDEAKAVSPVRKISFDEAAEIAKKFMDKDNCKFMLLNRRKPVKAGIGSLILQPYRDLSNYSGDYNTFLEKGYDKNSGYVWEISGYYIAECKNGTCDAISSPEWQFGIIIDAETGKVLAHKHYHDD